MNIAFLAPEFLPNWGGAGTYAIELVKYLSKKHNVHVVTLRRQNDNGSAYSDQNILDYFDNRINLHMISDASDTFLYNATFQYACLKQLPKICKENDIDIVHADVPHMSDVLLRLIKTHKNSVTTVHTIIEGHKEGILASGLDFWDMDASERYTLALFPMLKLTQWLYLRRSPTIITVSHWMKGLLEENYGLKGINVIHNGVDHELFSHENRNIEIRGLKTDRPIVLFSGRPIALKGINILIKAMRMVLNETGDVHFVFAGVEAKKKWIRMFETEGISTHYSLLGYIPHTEMPQLYSNSSIFILPSMIENCPFSLLEAMSSGVAVIASNVGGIPEIIDDGIDGILIEPGNPELLAEEILFLLRNETKRKELSVNARIKILKNFTSKIMSEKIEKVYEKLLIGST